MRWQDVPAAVVYRPVWWARLWWSSRPIRGVSQMPLRERLLYVFAFQRWRRHYARRW